MNENKWKYIPDGKIVIDFSDCKYVKDFHEKLKNSFGFPNYYGRNWDALWDCLRDFAISEEHKREIVLRGMNQMPEDLREYSQKGYLLFKELEQKYPILHFTIER